MPNLTHDELIEIAYRWVLKNAKCGFAFKELVTTSSETPDVIGFGAWGHSVLIECKASRADFFADKKKPHRWNSHAGMGRYRLYCVRDGLITPDELPPKWGLIYVDERGKARANINPMRFRYTESGKWEHEVNQMSERAVMYSALRRLQVRGRLSEIYEYPSQDTPQDATAQTEEF